MSICTRCGAEFGCAMADGSPEACWCTALPAAVPVPQEAAGCWCPACLRAHIDAEWEKRRVGGSPAHAVIVSSQIIRHESGAVSDHRVGGERDAG